MRLLASLPNMQREWVKNTTLQHSILSLPIKVIQRMSKRRLTWITIRWMKHEWTAAHTRKSQYVWTSLFTSHVQEKRLPYWSLCTTLKEGSKQNHCLVWKEYPDQEGSWERQRSQWICYKISDDRTAPIQWCSRAHFDGGIVYVILTDRISNTILLPWFLLWSRRKRWSQHQRWRNWSATEIHWCEREYHCLSQDNNWSRRLRPDPT